MDLVLRWILTFQYTFAFIPSAVDSQNNRVISHASYSLSPPCCKQNEACPPVRNVTWCTSRLKWVSTDLCKLHLSPLYRIEQGFDNWDVKIYRFWRIWVRFSVLIDFLRFCGFGGFVSTVLWFLIHPNVPLLSLSRPLPPKNEFVSEECHQRGCKDVHLTITTCKWLDFCLTIFVRCIEQAHQSAPTPTLNADNCSGVGVVFSSKCESSV